jgi:hypothetical protein
MSDSEMGCNTPEIILPSTADFGKFTVDFQIGFHLDGYEGYKELDEVKHNISTKLTVIKLPTVEEQFWPDPYDMSQKEHLKLLVNS